MSSFDSYISRVNEYIDSMKELGRKVKEYDCPGSVEELEKDLPVQIGPGANPGIILRSNTFTELGNPAAGSSAFLLWTEEPSLVRDGRITIIGPDIPESPGLSLPFGQILLMAGRELDPNKQEGMELCQHISDYLEGYMVRSSTQNIWGRVSKDAAARGFTLQTLGKALMIVMKKGVPEIESMEIVFVTSGREDLKPLEEIAGEVAGIRKDIIREFWKSQGYDLECDLDCHSCNDKEVCDDIKEMLRARWEKKQADALESEG
ncbi:MAG: hypothetical protein R6U89_08035 [Dehalococcoidia bacterium]